MSLQPDTVQPREPGGAMPVAGLMGDLMEKLERNREKWRAERHGRDERAANAERAVRMEEDSYAEFADDLHRAVVDQETSARKADAERFKREFTRLDKNGWEQHIPQFVRRLVLGALDTPSLGMQVEPELGVAERTLVDDVAKLRAEVSKAIGMPDRMERDDFDTVLCVAMLYDTVPDIARSDLVIAKVFCGLNGIEYRSHNEVLFRIVLGVWRKVDGVDYNTAERTMRVTLQAEAVFLIMSSLQVPRKFSDVVFEAACIVLTFSLQDLNEVVLRAGRRRENYADWTTQAAMNCASVRKAFSEKLMWVIEKFHKWCGSQPPVDGATGVTFQDCFLRIKDTSIVQAQRCPENNCYWMVEARLSMSPDLSKLRLLTRFISTTFAGREGSLDMIMALISLVARAENVPHVMLFLIGPGGEGKSLFTLNLLRSVFGTGHAECGSAMLQKEDEFRKQGHRFVMKAWLAFDEIKPNYTIEEEVFKVFTSGGKIDLRRNHEAETNSAAWPRSGKSWNGNVKDIPRIASAKEPTFARRLRAVRLLSRFTANSDEVDVANRLFAMDLNLETELSSPVISAMFWRFWLLPYIEETSVFEAKKKILVPCAQVKEDTEWLQCAMLGGHQQTPIPVTYTTTPMTTSSSATGEGHGAGMLVPPEARVAVDTFMICMQTRPTQRIWRQQQIRDLHVPSNTGTSRARDGTDSKVDVFMKSASHTPQLWQVVHTGRKYSGRDVITFVRHVFDLSHYMHTVNRILIARGLREQQIFGSWQTQSSGWKSMLKTYMEEPQVTEVETDLASDPTALHPDEKVTELVDLPSLRQYSQTQVDRRQGQLVEFIEHVERHGREVRPGIWDLPNVYTRKVIGGRPTGRLYGPRMSLQHLTREARRAACSSFCIDVDMVNSFFAMLQMLDEGATINKYKEHTDTFREFIAEYFGVSMGQAKIGLLMALFGRPVDMSERHDRGVPPFLTTLAFECAEAKMTLSTKRPELVQHFTTEGRRDPRLSALSYVLMDQEHHMLMQLISKLDDHGLHLVTPMFDGAIVTVKQSSDIGMLQQRVAAVMRVMLETCNVKLERKPWNNVTIRGLKRKSGPTIDLDSETDTEIDEP